MRSLSKLLGLMAVLCVVLVSCQKEISPEDVDPPVDPTPTGSDSSYIDKMKLLFDDGTTTTLDTFSYAQFYYDAQKRVKGITTYIADPGPTPEKSDSLLFFYQGTDTLPYKMLVVYFDAGVQTDDTVSRFFFYDAQKRKIKDSSIHHSNGIVKLKKVTSFTYNGDKVYGFTKDDDFLNSYFNEYKDTATVNTNGDILYSKQYVLDGNGSGDFLLYNEATYTYDNKKAPFGRPGLYQAFWNFPNGETIEFEFTSRNNVLTSIEQHHETPPSSFTGSVTYQYNTAGYPVKSVNDRGGSLKEIWYYTYKAL